MIGRDEIVKRAGDTTGMGEFQPAVCRSTSCLCWMSVLVGGQLHLTRHVPLRRALLVDLEVGGGYSPGPRPWSLLLKRTRQRHQLAACRGVLAVVAGPRGYRDRALGCSVGWIATMGNVEPLGLLRRHPPDQMP